jgi:MraZ protein
MFFYGEFPYAMDDRNRVPIPPAFRPDFEQKGIVMAPGADRCITVYTAESFDAEVAHLRELSRADKTIRDAVRHIFPNTRRMDRPDSQGRVVLEPRMVRWAGIEKDVVVVGADTSLEIWDRTTWEEGFEARQAAYEEALQRVSSLQNLRLGIAGGGGAS